MEDEVQYCKVIFLGEKGVGKTSLIIQFFHKKFQEDQQPLIRERFLTK